MTARRSFTTRSDACCVCGDGVSSLSATTSDPEAPEMIQLPLGAWAGLVRDEPTGEPRIVVCCSSDCLHQLLREEP